MAIRTGNFAASSAAICTPTPLTRISGFTSVCITRVLGVSATREAGCSGKTQALKGSTTGGMKYRKVKILSKQLKYNIRFKERDSALKMSRAVIFRILERFKYSAKIKWYREK